MKNYVLKPFCHFLHILWADFYIHMFVYNQFLYTYGCYLSVHDIQHFVRVWLHIQYEFKLYIEMKMVI